MAYERYLPDPIDLFLDRDARGENDTIEEPGRAPICEWCNEYCRGDIAFELEKNLWVCADCVTKARRKVRRYA